MLVTPHFVFLHLHKSGGTFVNDALLRFVPGTRTLGYHLPRSLLPQAHARLPAIGLIRNPWSYYVSWFAFQRSRPRANALFRVLSDDGRLGFEDTITRMLDLGRDDPLLERVLAVLPDSYGQSSLNLPASALGRIRGRALGFYSFLFSHVFEPQSGATLRVVRLEHLATELPRAMEQLGQPMDALFVRHLREAPRINSSTHPPYANCYGEALRDLVAERDGKLIRDYGYAFAS